jgi:hypothetical protein
MVPPALYYTTAHELPGPLGRFARFDGFVRIVRNNKIVGFENL